MTHFDENSLPMRPNYVEYAILLILVVGPTGLPEKFINIDPRFSHVSLNVL